MNERYEIWTLDENGYPMDLLNAYDSREEAVNDYTYYKKDYEREPDEYFDIILYQVIK